MREKTWCCRSRSRSRRWGTIIGLKKKVSATCEADAYDLYVCSHDENHTERRDIEEGSHTGHQYQLTGISSLNMNDGTTTFTWECQNDNHGKEDLCEKTLIISITTESLDADTTMTLGDLEELLPKVDGGELHLAGDVSKETPITADDTTVHVEFVPDSVKYAGYTGVEAVDAFGGQDLTLALEVEKAKLDFSGVSFMGTRVFVDTGNPTGSPITVQRGSLPEDVTAGNPIYQKNGGDSSTTPPSRDDTWSGTVSVTFTYDPDKYDVDAAKKPGGDYTFNDSEPGKVTITHSYDVVQQTMDDLKAAAITPLTYDPDGQNTVRLTGVPYGSQVSWSWKDVNNPQNTGTGSAESPADQNFMDTVPITDAGTYQVTITVTKTDFETKTLEPVTVTINKAPVATPVGASGLTYTGEEQVGLPDAPEGGHYTYLDGSVLSETDAGTYQATASLNDPANYAWTMGDDNQDGDVKITWKIGKRQVLETATRPNYANQSVPYNGKEHTAVREPQNATGFFDVTYEGSTLIGKVKDTDIQAFIITNARQTNAGTYTPIAEITDFDNFYWINHPDQESYELTSWTIGQLQFNAPVLRADNTTYDAEAYDGEITLTHSAESGSSLSSAEIVELGADRAYYETQYAVTSMEAPPVDAGTYWVEPELVYDSVNYRMLGGSTRVSFTIGKAELTLKSPDAELLRVGYTGEEQIVPPPDVAGLMERDGADDYTLSYTYTFTPAGSAEAGETVTVDGEMKVTEAGTYSISVAVDSECKNYQSETPAVYIFIIGSAGQTVELTSQTEGWDAESKTVTKTLGDEPFTVSGAGYVGTTPTNADVTYTSTDAKTASVDENGQVTLHKATAEGASVAITVTAAASANYGQGTATYTITIGKGTPVINAGEAQTYTYDGEAITAEEYKKATVSAPREGAAEPNQELRYAFYDGKDYATEDDVLADDATAMEDAPRAVGSYWLKVTYPGDDNYVENSEVVKITINEASVGDITASYIETYDGQAPDLAEIVEKIVAEKAITGATVQVMQSAERPTDEDDSRWQDSLTVKDVADSTNTNGNRYWYKVTAPGYGTAIGEITVNITPKEVTIEGTPETTKTYDGELDIDQSNVAFTVETGFENESFTVTATGAFASKNAEPNKPLTITYTLKPADGTVIGNYTFTNGTLTANGDGTGTVTQTATGEITKASITVTGGVAAQNKDYDGTTNVALMPTTDGIKFEGKQGTDDISVVLNTAGAQGRTEDADVNDNKAVTGIDVSDFDLEGDDAGNYEIKEVTISDVTVNIAPVEPDLSFDNAQGDTITVNFDGAALTEDDYGATAAKPESVSEAGTDPGGTISYQFYSSIQYTETCDTPSVVGTYYLEATYTPGTDDNYATTTARVTVVIKPAGQGALTVATHGYTGYYDGQEHQVGEPLIVKTAEGGEPVGTVTITYWLDENNQVSDVSQLTVKNAGTYTVHYQIKTANYGVQVGSFNAVISPAEFTLSSGLTGQENKVYDGNDTVSATLTETLTVTEGAQADNITVTAKAAYDSADVTDGNHINVTYTVTFADEIALKNYTYAGSSTQTAADGTVLTVTETADGQITKRTVTVTPNAASKTYGEEDPDLTYGVADPDINTGLVGEDEVTGNLNRATGEDVTEAGYAITGEGLHVITETGETSNNYTIELREAALTITPRPINVSIGNTSGTYGEEPNVENVTVTYQANTTGAGLAEDDDAVDGLTLGTNATASSGVNGNYKIYAVANGTEITEGTPTVVGNYSVTVTKNGSYTVTQRPITITVDNKTAFYGAAQEQLTYQVTTAVGEDAIVNDDLEDGRLTIALSTQAGPSSSVGTYEITANVGGSNSNNYTITANTPGTYTIEEAELSVSFSDDTVSTYVGGTVFIPATVRNASADLDISLPESGVTVTYDTSDDTVATVDNDGTVLALALGTVTVTVTVTGTDNYKGTVSDSYTLTIAPSSGGAGVTVTGNSGLTYDGRPQALVTVVNPEPQADMTYTVTGPDGNPQKFTNEIPTGTDAGDYTVEWEAAYAPGSGYENQSGTVSVHISKATIQDFFVDPTVTVAYTTSAYSGNLTDEASGLLGSGVFDGTIEFISIDTSVASFANAKDYHLTLNGLGDTTVYAYVRDSRNYENCVDSFILHVKADTNEIISTATPVHVTYDGASHGPDIQVTNPGDGYEILYGLTEGVYDTNVAPTFTNASDEAYTVYFQVTASGYDPVTGKATVKIDKREIDDDMIQGVRGSYSYIGEQIKPPVSVVYGNEVLSPEDYTLDYGDNISGSGSVIVTVDDDCTNFTGSAEVTFTISARDADYLSASLDNYFGFVGDDDLTATPTVTFAGQVLTYGTDYTVTATGGTVNLITGTVDFSGVEPGPYTITITPTGGNFAGTAINLPYHLLTAEDGALLGDGDVQIYTYGDDHIDGTITVKDENEIEVPRAEYDLTYTYYPNDSNSSTNGNYDPTVLDDAGLYVVTATGKPADPENGILGAYENQSSVYVFLILPRDLADARITVEDAEYTGSPVEPDVTVSAPGNPVENIDYTVSYRNNIEPGEGYVWVTAQGNNYVGAALQPFPITSADDTPLNFTLTVSPTSLIVGEQVRSIIVSSETGELTIGTEYTLTIEKDGETVYNGNDTDDAIAAIAEEGRYTVTATGMGDYLGRASTVTVTVSPDPNAPTLAVSVDPTYLSGGGNATVTVTVTNPVNADPPTLTVSGNGTTNTLYLTDRGSGVYTAVFNAPDASATYTFTATHGTLTDRATLRVSASGGGDSGDGGDGGRTYIIEASAGVGGSISPSGRVRVSSGSDRTFRITPDDGYAIASVVVDGRGVGHMSSYTFENVREDHTIEVTFRRVTELGDPEATGVADWLNTVDHSNFLNGYSNGTFRPDANMTRAQAAQMFYNLLLDKNVPSTASYSDVAPDAWCAEAVRVMSALGIVTGYSDGTFRPNEPITRAQFAVIAMRFTDVTAPYGQSFSDVPSTAWYYDEVMGAAGFGWLSGYSDGTFRPNNPITRAEVAVIVNRMLGRSADESYINSHLLEIQQFTDLGLPHWAFYDIMEAANSHDYRKESGVEYWQSI